MSVGNKIGKFIDGLKLSSHSFEDRLSTEKEVQDKYKGIFGGIFKKFIAKPLATEEEMKKFYEPLAKEQHKEFSSYLKIEQKKVKCLFTGHHGSGISTELNALKFQLKDDFYTINFSIQEIFDPGDLVYQDIFFLMGMKLLEDLLNYEKDEIFTSVYNLYLKYTKPESTATDNIDYKAKFKDICFILKIEAESRKIMRKDIEDNLLEIIKFINKATEKIEQQTKKKLLIIVDDIEKVNVETALKIIDENSRRLILPNCRIIYTMPLLAYYTKKFPVFNRRFDRCLVMPLIKIYSKENKENEKAMEVFEKIVGKRMDMKIYFDMEVLPDIIVRTGGMVKCLIELVRKSCLELTRNPKAIIDDEIFEKVIKQWKAEQYPLLNVETRSALRKVYTSKSNKIKDELFAELLDRDLILEYRNNDIWFDIHPLIREAAGVEEEPEYEDIKKK
jgi:hypothetical protein